jgi:hypothetical protein
MNTLCLLEWYVVFVHAHMLAEVVMSTEILATTRVRTSMGCAHLSENGIIAIGRITTHVFRGYGYFAHVVLNVPLSRNIYHSLQPHKGTYAPPSR